MEQEMTNTQIRTYLQDNKLYVDEIYSPLKGAMETAVVDITVIAGDWKHDHGFLCYLMQEKGYYETQNNLIHDEYTDDGDDCYSARHRFVFRPFYEMFNGKINN